MRLIVGLRNPGTEYEGTRHNVGAEVVSAILESAEEPLKRAPGRIRGMVGTVGFGDDRVVYLLPNTFMNDSGAAVVAAMRYFKTSPDDTLIIHDDIDVPFGKLKLQVGRGSGGHNGIRSVEKALGSNEFWRLKVGVGRPPGSQDPADYVLRRFSSAERSEVDLFVRDGLDVAEAWVHSPSKAQELAANRSKDG